jgi:type II secretory pathway pseudopilin PulG
MSDTTAFVGGAALAGLTALIVLKGGVTIGAPNVNPPQALPNFSSTPLPTVPGTVSPLPTPPSLSPSPVSAYDLEKQQLATEQLKTQLEQQRTQAEQLKNQLQSQQALIDALTAQNKVAAPPSPYSGRYTPSSENPEPVSPIVAGLLWALGGMILTFGGGIALVGMFVLFSRNQRPNRTVEVIHEDYPTYLPMRRRSQMLPPRRAIRRVNAEEID